MPPDTRNSSFAESLASLSASFAELAARTQTVETTLTAEAAKNAAESARNTATFERVLGMLDQLSGSVREIQMAARHAEKQPMQEPSLTPPLSPLPQPIFGSYSSTPRPTSSTIPLAIEGNSAANQRLPRIEIPVFTGEGVEGWLFQLNRFFAHYAVPPDQKLFIASFHMAGDAWKWIQWLHATQQRHDWESFSTANNTRFGPPAYYSAEALINKLCQTGSVDTYIDEFETLSMRAPGLTADNLHHRFIAGLKDEIHSEIVMFHLATLQQAMGLARLSEQKLDSLRTRQFTPSLVPRPLALLPAPPVARPALADLPIKRLTPVEMATRRDKGLCFNCDDKFTPGHKCKPRFQSLVMEDDHLVEELNLLPQETPTDEYQDIIPNVDEVPNISFHALQGRLKPSTLRVRGGLQGRRITVLIDGGSTHNFLQARVAKHANLIIEPSTHLQVIIGNGDELQCEGFCREVPLRLGNHVFHINFFLLSIYGADAVLGAQWLQDIGPALFDYKDLWMMFEYNGETVRLEGLKVAAELACLTLGKLKRASRKHAISSMFQLTLNMVAQDPQDLPTPILEQGHLPTTPAHLNAFKINALLALLQQIAHIIQGLPPPRPTDHYNSLTFEARPMDVLALSRNPQPSLLALPGQSRPMFGLLRAMRHLLEVHQSARSLFQHTMTRITSQFHCLGLRKDVAELPQNYPNFNLEVEVSTEGGSNVAPKADVATKPDVADPGEGTKRTTKDLQPSKNYPNEIYTP